MAFDYPVNLDLEGRPVVVFGGGPLASARVERLVEVGASVTVVAEAPQADLEGLDVKIVRRQGRPEDLDGAFLAIVTGEDPAPVGDLYEAAARGGILFAAIDDVAHSDFGAASEIRRGDLQITISTSGKAPALSKRLRQELELAIDDAYGVLVDVLHRARARLLPRSVPFEVWAAAWGEALTDLDGLVELVRDGQADVAEERIVAAVSREL